MNISGFDDTKKEIKLVSARHAMKLAFIFQGKSGRFLQILRLEDFVFSSVHPRYSLSVEKKCYFLLLWTFSVGGVCVGREPCLL